MGHDHLSVTVIKGDAEKSGHMPLWLNKESKKFDERLHRCLSRQVKTSLANCNSCYWFVNSKVSKNFTHALWQITQKLWLFVFCLRFFFVSFSSLFLPEMANKDFQFIYYILVQKLARSQNRISGRQWLSMGTFSPNLSSLGLTNWPFVVWRWSRVHRPRSTAVNKSHLGHCLNFSLPTIRWLTHSAWRLQQYHVNNGHSRRFCR